jgi:hypothetical protein
MTFFDEQKREKGPRPEQVVEQLLADSQAPSLDGAV